MKTPMILKLQISCCTITTTTWPKTPRCLASWSSLQTALHWRKFFRAGVRQWCIKSDWNLKEQTCIESVQFNQSICYAVLPRQGTGGGQRCIWAERRFLAGGTDSCYTGCYFVLRDNAGSRPAFLLLASPTLQAPRERQAFFHSHYALSDGAIQPGATWQDAVDWVDDSVNLHFRDVISDNFKRYSRTS